MAAEVGLSRPAVLRSLERLARLAVR
ncbi:MAG: hypothetical protein ACXWN5_07815 [Candidatus Limnocylindrales bacterium]